MDGVCRLAEMRDRRGEVESVRTSSSLRRLHSSQPPSHLFFIRFTATSLLFAYSGRAPAPHCMAERGVLGGSVPCQSQSQTVPKEPSPTTLRGVYVRAEPRERGKRGGGQREEGEKLIGEMVGEVRKGSAHCSGSHRQGAHRSRP